MTYLAIFHHWTYTPRGAAILYHSGRVALACAMGLLIWVLAHPQ